MGESGRGVDPAEAATGGEHAAPAPGDQHDDGESAIGRRDQGGGQGGRPGERREPNGGLGGGEHLHERPGAPGEARDQGGDCPGAVARARHLRRTGHDEQHRGRHERSDGGHATAPTELTDSAVRRAFTFATPTGA